MKAVVLKDYFRLLRAKYPDGQKIHLILDRGPYNRSVETVLAAKLLNIEIHFLPAYSPNLNPIERLWKIMNEFTRNNTFFHSAKDFRTAINHFFESV